MVLGEVSSFLGMELKASGLRRIELEDQPVVLGFRGVGSSRT